jgi:hypothetical protein
MVDQQKELFVENYIQIKIGMSEWKPLCGSFSADERKVIEDLATRLGMSTNQFVRKCVTAYVDLLPRLPILTDESSPLVQGLRQLLSEIFNDDTLRKLETRANELHSQIDPAALKETEEN